MKLHIHDSTRPLFVLIAAAIVAGFLLASCGGGGYGGGSGGMLYMLPPGTFSLTSPMNGATNEPKTGVMLSWSTSLYATGYFVYVKKDTDAAYPAPVQVSGTSYTTVALSASTLYDWKVTAFNTSGMATAGPFTFTTGP